MTMAPKGTPIWIDCEGSGCPGHGTRSEVICSMCGRMVATEHAEGYGLVTIPHRRDDIIARIYRGDFG